jgi:hypothetical protein
MGMGNMRSTSASFTKLVQEVETGGWVDAYRFRCSFPGQAKRVVRTSLLRVACRALVVSLFILACVGV